MRLTYYFDTWAIIWHGIIPVFLKICKKFAAICCCCTVYISHFSSLWHIITRAQGRQIVSVIVSEQFYYRNNNKNNFAFLANLCKSSEILKQYNVKCWFNYRIYGSVSYSFSCTLLLFFSRGDFNIFSLYLCR